MIDDECHVLMPEVDLIILMRHGESEANVNPEKYASVGDPNIQLTKDGIQQVYTIQCLTPFAFG